MSMNTSTRVHQVADRPASRGKAWGLTFFLVALYTVNFGNQAVLGLAAQPLKVEYGLTSSQIGTIGSAFFGAMLVGGLLAGTLSKWLTLRWALALLALAWAVVMLPMVFAAGFAVLLISRLLLGLAEGPSASLIFTAAYSWHPEDRRSLPATVITSAASLSKVAIAPVLAVVIAQWGWRAGFLVLAGVAVLWCVVWLLIWSDGPYGAQRGQGSSAGSEPVEKNGAAEWRRLLLTPTFLAATFAAASMFAVIAMGLTWIPSYFEQGLGYSRVQSGTMFALPSAAALVFMFLFSFLSDQLLGRGVSKRLVRGVLPAAGLVLGGVALLLLPVFGVPAVAVLVLSVGYGLGSTVMPLFNAAVADVAPPRQLAGALGVFTAACYVGGIIGPLATGKLVAAGTGASGYLLAFQIFGGVALVAAFIAMVAVNPVRDALRMQQAVDQNV
ncbi:MFS transporter [Rhodococcus sp. NPDC127530]|uniref:MFS transporter n=1 Tax=unclassified Rhodococcus (in: high G+C Gram-positive bacteria) TaxID=192944 RepID=UPI0036332F4A